MKTLRLDEATYQQFVARRIALQADVTRLESQRTDARQRFAATKQRADPAWYRQVEATLSTKQRQLKAINQRLQEEQRQRGLEKRVHNQAQQQTVEQCFMQLVKNSVNAETFERLMATAQDMAQRQTPEGRRLSGKEPEHAC